MRKIVIIVFLALITFTIAAHIATANIITLGINETVLVELSNGQDIDFTLFHIEHGTAYASFGSPNAIRIFNEGYIDSNNPYNVNKINSIRLISIGNNEATFYLDYSIKESSQKKLEPLDSRNGFKTYYPDDTVQIYSDLEHEKYGCNGIYITPTGDLYENKGGCNVITKGRNNLSLTLTSFLTVFSSRDITVKDGLYKFFIITQEKSQSYRHIHISKSEVDFNRKEPYPSQTQSLNPIRIGNENNDNSVELYMLTSHPASKETYSNLIKLLEKYPNATVDIHMIPLKSGEIKYSASQAIYCSHLIDKSIGPLLLSKLMKPESSTHLWQKEVEASGIDIYLVLDCIFNEEVMPQIMFYEAKGKEMVYSLFPFIEWEGTIERYNSARAEELISASSKNPIMTQCTENTYYECSNGLNVIECSCTKGVFDCKEPVCNDEIPSINENKTDLMSETEKIDETSFEPQKEKGFISIIINFIRGIFVRN